VPEATTGTAQGRWARGPYLGRRFATAAEAIRFAVEEMPAVRTLGAWMQLETSALTATRFASCMSVAIIRLAAMPLLTSTLGHTVGPPGTVLVTWITGSREWPLRIEPTTNERRSPVVVAVHNLLCRDSNT
jgi:hypothetical protein